MNSFTNILVTRLIDKMFEPGSSIYLPDSIPEHEPLADTSGHDLGVPLFGEGIEGIPKGNMIIDLKNQELTGLKAIHKNDSGDNSGQEIDDYILCHVAFKVAGPYVPAHPSDFNNDDNYMGDPITGPTTLTGISDFPGMRVLGNFTAHQGYEDGSQRSAPGTYISTINNVLMRIIMKIFYPPSGTDEPYHSQVTEFGVEKIIAKQITITLFHQDKSLPQYDISKIFMGNIGDDTTQDKEINYYYAQQLVNFPPEGMPSLHEIIARKINDKFSDKAFNQKIRKNIQGKMDTYLSKNISF